MFVRLATLFTPASKKCSTPEAASTALTSALVQPRSNLYVGLTSRRRSKGMLWHHRIMLTRRVQPRCNSGCGGFLLLRVARALSFGGSNGAVSRPKQRLRMFVNSGNQQKSIGEMSTAYLWSSALRRQYGAISWLKNSQLLGGKVCSTVSLTSVF